MHRSLMYPIAMVLAFTALVPHSRAHTEKKNQDDPSEFRVDYRALSAALTRYRALASDTTIAEFPTPRNKYIHRGDSLATLPQLRARLTALGDLAPEAAKDSTGRYDEPVFAAVQRFQVRHGLAGDGTIGPATVAALQFPLMKQVAKIEASLANIRKETALTGGRYIVVNVPAFRMLAFEGTNKDTAAAIDMRVIVGHAALTPTPILEMQMQFVEFRPYWNVPRSILLREVLPKMRRDAGYLARENMEIVSQNEKTLGDEVTAGRIAALRDDKLRVRQRPGEANSLGLVKFVIPNDSNIYLHDTPQKELFDEARRDFSHGCIRLHHARDVAVWVMQGDAGWSADSVDKALAGPQNMRVKLERAIQVFLEYNTAMATADGRVWFPPDVYHLDEKNTKVAEVSHGPHVKAP